jgi:hypothetical protein
MLGITIALVALGVLCWGLQNALPGLLPADPDPVRREARVVLVLVFVVAWAALALVHVRCSYGTDGGIDCRAVLGLLR